MQRYRPAFLHAVCIALIAAFSTHVMAGERHEIGADNLDASLTETVISVNLWEQTAFVNADLKNPDELKPDAVLSVRRNVIDRASDVIIKLENMNIDAHHIDVSRLNIKRTQTAENLDSGDPLRMIATRVEHPIKITLHDPEKVPQVLDILTRQEASSFRGITYSINGIEYDQHRQAKHLSDMGAF